MISDQDLLSSCDSQRRAVNEQDLRTLFRGAQGFGQLGAVSRASFTGSRPPPPWTSVLFVFLLLYDVWP